MATKPKPVSIDTKLQVVDEIDKKVKSNQRRGTHLPFIAKHQAVHVIKR